MESEKTYSILVVDDDAGISAFMQRRLQQVGYQVRLKFTGREATDWLKANRADLMLLDMELPDMKGYEVVEELERECRSIPFVVITGHGDEQLAVDMMKAGAVDYVIKDPSLPELLNSVVERAFRQIEQEQQLHEAEEALRRAYDELEVRVQQRTAELAESEVKYRTLVENLPQNIFFKNADSRYVSCNHNFARYLGTSPARIVGKTDYDFCPPDEAEKYRQEDIRILQDGRTEEIEERLFRDGQERIELKIKTPVKDEEGKVVGILGIFWDITERKKSEDALRLSHHILEIVVRQRDPKELLNEVIAEVRDFTGCEAIAIRILDENDNIPYQALIGFSKRFYDLESPLSIKKDRCMCINVICGRTLPKASFYTDGGSFYMNGTTRFLSTVSEKQKGQTRNVCNEFGYESVALIPIRIGDTILGLIHIADRKENRVPLEKVETLEKIAMELAAAILRSRAEEALRISEARLRQVMESMPVMMEAFDQKGNIIFWSKECERVTGYTAAEIEGNPRAMEMLYPDLEYRRRIMEEWRRRGNNYRNWERTLTCKDGNKQIISWSNISDRAPIPGWASWGIGLDVTENKRAEDERLNRFRRLRRQQTAIVRMAVDKSVAAGHLKDAFRLITQNAAHALNVARAGIWLLSKDSRQMKCVDLYQSATERHSEGDVLYIEQCPHYFKALERGKAIDAHDARSDPRTREFKDTYLVPRGIISELDGAIRISGKVVGVVCLEHTGSRRVWTADEVAFVGQISDHVANTLLNYERKHTEESLAQTNEILERIFSTTYMLIAYMDSNFNFIRVNRAYAEADNKEPEYFAGKNHFDLYPNPENKEIFRQVLQSGTPFTVTAKPFQYPDNPERGISYWDWTLHPVKDASGNVEGLLLYLLNVTERKKHEEDLMVYHDHLRSLASELSLTEERERRRIASDLHDSIGQTLAFLQIKLELLREAAAGSDVTGPLGEISELIRQTIDDTHSLIFDLSPPVLHELGLDPAIEWLAEEIQKQYGLEVMISKDVSSKQQLDTDKRVVLFRAIRELLVNVAKHAQASCAKVHIVRGDRDIRVTVEDDGVGFQASQEGMGINHNGGFGLFNIQERVEHFGGHIQVVSSAGEGTKVSLTMPWDKTITDSYGHRKKLKKC